MLKAFCGTRILLVQRVIFHVPQPDAPAMLLYFRREQIYPSFHVLSARRRKHPYPLPRLKIQGYLYLTLSVFQDTKNKEFIKEGRRGNSLVNET